MPSLGPKAKRVAAGSGALLFMVALWGGFAWLYLSGFDPQALIVAAGPLGPLVLILLHAGQVVLAPVPGQVIPMAAGYLYGPVWGGVWDSLGMCAGSLLAYLIGYKWGRPAARWFVGEGPLARGEEVIKRHPVWVFIAFLIPGLPKDAMCYAAGILRFPLRLYLLLLVVVRVPVDYSLILLGSGIRFLHGPSLFLTLAAFGFGVALLVLIGYWVKKKYY